MDFDFDVITFIFGNGDDTTWFFVGCMTGILIFSFIVNRNPKK